MITLRVTGGSAVTVILYTMTICMWSLCRNSHTSVYIIIACWTKAPRPFRHPAPPPLTCCAPSPVCPRLRCLIHVNTLNLFQIQKNATCMWGQVSARADNGEQCRGRGEQHGVYEHCTQVAVHHMHIYCSVCGEHCKSNGVWSAILLNWSEC